VRKDKGDALTFSIIDEKVKGQGALAHLTRGGTLSMLLRMKFIGAVNTRKGGLRRTTGKNTAIIRGIVSATYN
jgi:hypothetical protein